MKPPFFAPIKPPPDPDHVASFVQRFGLQIKEHETTLVRGGLRHEEQTLPPT